VYIFIAFYAFFNFPKREYYGFFELLHTFSRTLFAPDGIAAYSIHGRGTEYCDERVCLSSVCSHISGTTYNASMKFSDLLQQTSDAMPSTLS